MESPNTQRLQLLFKNQANSRCLHCGRPSKQWAELTHAIFLCLDCAAAFREYNWITKIRSVNLEEWSEEDVSRMERGGNESFGNFLQSYGLELAEIRVKISCRASKYYRDMLDGKASGAQPGQEEGRLVDKEGIPLGDMSPEEMLEAAKEKALWLGSKTKEVGMKGAKKVQEKWESGQIQEGAKTVATNVSQGAKWVWGKLVKTFDEVTSNGNSNGASSGANNNTNSNS